MNDVSVDGMLGAVIDMLANIEIVALTAAMMVSDFVSRVTYALEVCAGPITGDVTGIGSKVDTSGVAAVMTALEFAVPARVENLLLSC